MTAASVPSVLLHLSLPLPPRHRVPLFTPSQHVFCAFMSKSGRPTSPPGRCAVRSPLSLLSTSSVWRALHFLFSSGSGRCRRKGFSPTPPQDESLLKTWWTMMESCCVKEARCGGVPSLCSVCLVRVRCESGCSLARASLAIASVWRKHDCAEAATRLDTPRCGARASE